ncbi:Wd-repeat protein [Operophtera brumata]|uniref:Wd-repeat protein n=1 Tax=Operophtera brumata TaxID=104452 RepID=A0A0L7LRX6_OPEBR|nr:Wd-repeat protein [Operophtera brumata]
MKTMKESKQGQTPIEDLADLRSYFATHNSVREYVAHSAKVHSVGWSCDGRRLASGSYDKNVAIFNLERSRLAQDFLCRGHTGSVDQLCWHASHSDLLSTASGDKSVRIWDIRSHKCAASISTKGENINIAWSPNGSTIAVGNKEDLHDPTGRYFATGSADALVSLWDVNELACLRVSIEHDPTGRYFATGSADVLVSLWDVNELACLRVSIEHDPTGRYFATGSADALVSLWDVNELACLRVFTSFDGRLLASASEDHIIDIGDTQTVRTLSFSFDGRLLASASEDHIIDIGDTQTVQASTFTVSWHPSRYLVAFACDDKDAPERKRDAGNLKLWGMSSSSS